MAGRLLPADLGDQAAPLQALEDGVAVDPADRLDPGAGHRLPVGDDRQRLHRGPAEPRGPLRVEGALHRPGHLWTGHQLELVIVALEHQPVAAQRGGQGVEGGSQLARRPAEHCGRLGDGERTVQRVAEGLEGRHQLLDRCGERPGRHHRPGLSGSDPAVGVGRRLLPVQGERLFSQARTR